MEHEVIIIQNRLDIVMRSISKIIEIVFKIKPLSLTLQNINNRDSFNGSRLLIIDESIFEECSSETMNHLKLYLSTSNIIVIAITSNIKIEKELLTWNNLELINLWHHNSQAFQFLTLAIKRKLLV